MEIKAKQYFKPRDSGLFPDSSSENPTIKNTQELLNSPNAKEGLEWGLNLSRISATIKGKIIGPNCGEPGIYIDDAIPGLRLRKIGSKCVWIFRRRVDGKTHDLGLGRLQDVSHTQARIKALELRNETEETFLARFNNHERTPETFEDVAKLFGQWNIQIGKWTDQAKSYKIYIQRLNKYILPILGGLQFDKMNCRDVAELARKVPINTEMGHRCMNIVKAVFDWGTAMGYTNNANPADLHGALKYLLVHVNHTAHNLGALQVSELPKFMKALHDRMSESNGMRCAFFQILTATRSMTARLAKWSQIDFEKREWRIPPSQLKVSDNGELIVPLAEEVIQFLKELDHTNELIFPNRYGKLMSDTMVSSVVRRLGGKWLDAVQTLKQEKEVRATIHGIARATFRTWSQDDSLGNDKRFDARIAELCLHHKQIDKYRGAYERNTSMLRRREMMEEWAKFCFKDITSS